MKYCWSIVVLCGLACIITLSTGCKPIPEDPPDLAVYSDTGDVEAKEITVSPNPARVDENVSIPFKVANIGATNVKANVKYIALGRGNGFSYYSTNHPSVKILQGAVITETDSGWRPVTTGGYAITCEVSLGNDTNPSNNFMSIDSLIAPSTPVSVVYVPYDDGKFQISLPKNGIPQKTWRR
ncbi:hypothetical protein COZ71_02210 [Candidatus Desantisbacteria bacterium CG_4_8_14_3_um_filter_40_12]|uniref:CARDB domain-containing protein n=2 Tax=unclassified Candidatus Desantisiibacteriota TaxID=3106372 RepID=A0A2M7JE35_9BACT|nr:MAG: hypothetical protein COX18_02825 [Candidatus Desantisbacteria bacterium CG23_combo_of_CG06-09_8_20_14_all_40_23]PIX17643.1 MAG: hypothetical protein COZ71_02210 [Candidatus Desantisbacteria bacterium CG_4_8_14_3_um_filter_40_12]